MNAGPRLAGVDNTGFQGGSEKNGSSSQVSRERFYSIETERENDSKESKMDILYSINDVPPWYLCIVLGFQHYLTMFSGTVSVPLILAKSLCLDNYLVAQSEIISTTFVIMGISTLLQSTIGTRLPVIQGCTAAFLIPALSILQLPQYRCPVAENSTLTSNDTNATFAIDGVDGEEPWRSRLMMVSGTIAVASAFQVIIGASGLISILLRFLGPLVITPTIALIGISLVHIAVDSCQHQWWIAFATCAIIMACSNYLMNVKCPMLGYSREEGCHLIWFPIFKTFPVIIGIVVMWVVSVILTAAGAFPSDPEGWGYKARTDINSDVLRDSAWIRFPYPGQFGTPTVYGAGILGMCAGVLASVVESCGDYIAAARLSGAPPPPSYAINRGIIMEGVGCLLSGLFGIPVGTTSYSENIGAIAITKVGSRRVVQAAGCIMVVVGIFNKVGALFVSLPLPIIGGVYLAMFSMVTGVGLANLQYVDLNSSRNVFIVGFSIFMGLGVPSWAGNPANRAAINFGNVDWLEETLIVLLTTNMFVGGFIAFVLDNTMPGTLEERGIAKFRGKIADETEEAKEKRHENLLGTYDVPFGKKLFGKISWLRFLPFCAKYRKNDNRVEFHLDETHL